MRPPWPRSTRHPSVRWPVAGVAGAAGRDSRRDGSGRVTLLGDPDGFEAPIPVDLATASNGPSKTFCCSGVSRPEASARVEKPTSCRRVSASGRLAASICFTALRRRPGGVRATPFCAASGLTDASSNNWASAALREAKSSASPIVFSTRLEKAAARSPRIESAFFPSRLRMLWRLSGPRCFGASPPHTGSRRRPPRGALAHPLGQLLLQYARQRRLLGRIAPLPRAGTAPPSPSPQIPATRKRRWQTCRRRRRTGRCGAAVRGGAGGGPQRRWRCQVAKRGRAG